LYPEKLMRSRVCAFTLMELVTVILIVAVLSGITIPAMRTRLDRGKWTEANAGAGIIRRAVKAFHASTGQEVTGQMDNADVQKALEIAPRDLAGTYFVPADYRILSVTDDGLPVIQVTGSRSNAPSGSKLLTADGTWQDVDTSPDKIKPPKKTKDPKTPKKEK